MKNNKDQVRQSIAAQAARIMAEEAIKDYFTAKRKAIARMGLPQGSNLPTNLEVEKALEEYQRLFKGDAHTKTIRELRQTALEAMEFFKEFEPRLVGSVLSGRATEHSDINLHLFADYPEQVDIFLVDQEIPFQRTEKRIKLSKEESINYPGFRFIAGDKEIELTVFPKNGLKQNPRSPVDGGPMQRANITMVQNLLDKGETKPT